MLKISEVAQHAVGKWEHIFTVLGIETGGGKHCPCPACKGKDRFRFDNREGRGTYICNQCGAGDGLDLVQKCFECDSKKAANKVMQCLGLSSDTVFDTIIHYNSSNVPENNIRDFPVCKKVEYLLSKSKLGQSEYLTGKKLNFDLPLLDNERIFVPILNIHNEYVGGQFINPNGKKRLMEGTCKKGAFIPINSIKSNNLKVSWSDEIIICEGLATGITLSLIHAEATIVSSIDASNLVHVAKAIREINPNAKIIIAGDNDIGNRKNVGKEKAIEAAMAVNGYYVIPDTDFKCDWDDYRQQYGIKKAKQDFEQLVKNSQVPIHATKLPLSFGSEGFDTQLSYIIKGIIPANSLCSIYGASGSYKSFLATSWACHIASGLTWGGRKVAKGAALYVVGEGGIGVPRRIKAWELMHNQIAGNVCLINTPVFPAAPQEVGEVLKAVKQVECKTGLPVKLIIIDTLARCFGSSDENDAKDMGAFIRGCDELKAQSGAAILVVHHSGKDETKGARGSSAFRAALDAEFRINREGEGGALIMSCTKMKDGEEIKNEAYDLKSVELFTDNDDEVVNSLIVIDKPREPVEEDSIIKAVSNKTDNHVALWQCVRSRTEAQDFCTIALVRDDMKALGYDTKNFRRWLGKLEKDGFIQLEGENICPISKRNDRQKSKEESE